MRIVGEGVYAFDAEGVVVRVPLEISQIIPRQLELEWSPDMWNQDDFQPLRLVINLEFIDRTNPGKPPGEFYPPIEVQIYYTSTEKTFVVQQRSPRLAYWKVDHWVLIQDAVDVYPVLGQGWTGFLRFEITTWGDPTIALGL